MFSQNGLNLSRWNLYFKSKFAVQPLSIHTRLFYNYLFGQLRIESSGKIIKTSIYFKQMLLALLVRFTFEIQCKIKQKSNNNHKAHHHITFNKLLLFPNNHECRVKHANGWMLYAEKEKYCNMRKGAKEWGNIIMFAVGPITLPRLCIFYSDSWQLRYFAVALSPSHINGWKSTFVYLSCIKKWAVAAARTGYEITAWLGVLLPLENVFLHSNFNFFIRTLLI